MPLLPHPVAARVCAPLWSFFAALVLGPFLTDVVAPHQKVFAVFGLLPCALLPFGGITCSCEGAGTSETPASSNEYYEYAPPVALLPRRRRRIVRRGRHGPARERVPARRRARKLGRPGSPHLSRPRGPDLLRRARRRPRRPRRVAVVLKGGDDEGYTY